MRRLGLQAPFDVVVCAALGYVALEAFQALLCVLDLVSDAETLVLWGGGHSSTNELNATRTPLKVLR